MRRVEELTGCWPCGTLTVAVTGAGESTQGVPGAVATCGSKGTSAQPSIGAGGVAE